jgi:hypothetical protein
MTSRRRSSNKNLGNSISDVRRRIRYLERKPIRTKLQNRVIKAAAIAPSSITADEVSFGTNTVVDIVGTEDPKNLVANLKAGDEITDRETGEKKVYDELNDQFISIKDPAAQASADGKNKIYRQNSQPTGGTYVQGDTWFDTDDDNKIYRYDGTSWVGFTLGDNALASISANKITAGTIDARVITVSYLDAGSITSGTMSADRISGGTITGALFNLAGTNSYGALTITNVLRYGSPSLTWGPTATPYFEIYQFSAGDSTVISADGTASNGTLFINASNTLQFQSPETVSSYNIKMPSASSGTGAGGKGIRNIYSYATSLPNVALFNDGDIVVVY